MINRRGLLLGLFAAPAIVKAASLMPVKVIPAAAEPVFRDPLAGIKGGEGWTFSAYIKDKAGVWVRVARTFGENPLPTMKRLTDEQRALIIRNLLAPEQRPAAGDPWGVQLEQAVPGPGWGPRVEASRTNLLTMSNRRLPDAALRELTTGDRWDREASRPDAVGVKHALIQNGGHMEFRTPWTPNGLYVDENTGPFVIPFDRG